MKTEPRNTKECQWPPETGREKEWILLRTILISDLWPLELWQNEFYCLKPLVCGNLLWQPQKASAGPSTGERDGGVLAPLFFGPPKTPARWVVMEGEEGWGKPTFQPCETACSHPHFLHSSRAQFGAGIVHSHMSSSQPGHNLWVGAVGMGVWQPGLAQAGTALLLS